MELDVSVQDAQTLRNALALRHVQLGDLVKSHDDVDQRMQREGVSHVNPDRLRNARMRNSLLYEVARVEDLDRALLKLLGNG